MREALGPPLRAAALTALIVGLVVLLLNPPSLGGLDDLMVLILGALAIILLTAWFTVALIGKEIPAAGSPQRGAGGVTPTGPAAHRVRRAGDRRA